jgi:hypothetical protein
MLEGMRRALLLVAALSAGCVGVVVDERGEEETLSATAPPARAPLTGAGVEPYPWADAGSD